MRAALTKQKNPDGQFVVQKILVPYNNDIQINHVKRDYYQLLNGFVVIKESYDLNQGV